MLSHITKKKNCLQGQYARAELITPFLLSGTIRACKKAALECEEAKFEQYKLAAGDRITTEIIESIQSCFDKICTDMLLNTFQMWLLN